MNIHLHIDELVLEGLPPQATDSIALKAALETELVRMLANGGPAPGPYGGGSRPSVSTDDIQLAEGSTATVLGQQIGQTVYRGIYR
ncbi:MAG: hypothetical protein ABW098_08205 [Candidatus Thiodiazotropha sp.]